MRIGKNKIEFYCHKTWFKDGFKQFNLIPTLYYVITERFIETGVSTSAYIISINFLIWDIGFIFSKDLPSGDTMCLIRK